MDMEFINGQMEEDMKVSGKMANSMDKEIIICKTGR